MNNKPDVLFVDTHSECNGCDYHLKLVFHPLFLDVRPFGIAEASVIEIALYLVITHQNFVKTLTLFFRITVNNSTFPFEPKLHQSRQICVFSLDLLSVSDFIE